MAFYPIVMIHKTCFPKSVAQNITVYTHSMQNGLNIARNIHWLAVPILLIYWISTLPFYKEQISPAPLLDLKKIFHPASLLDPFIKFEKNSTPPIY